MERKGGGGRGVGRVNEGTHLDGRDTQMSDIVPLTPVTTVAAVLPYSAIIDHERVSQAILLSRETFNVKHFTAAEPYQTPEHCESKPVRHQQAGLRVEFLLFRKK